MASSLTIGSVLAALFQFLVISVLIVPLMAVSSPAQFAKTFNGTVAETELNITGTSYSLNGTQLAHNSQSLTQQIAVSGNQSGANVSTGTLSAGLGGLAFIPSALALFYKSMLNTPTVFIRLFSSLSTAMTFLPFSIMWIISIAFEGWLVVILVLKLFALITKTVPEEI